MDVFEEFDPAPATADDGPRRTSGIRGERGPGRTALLAALAAAAALVALVGGVFAAAKILVPDAAPGCDQLGRTAQSQLVSFLQDTVNNTVELGREVLPVGCEAGGPGPGAAVDLIDDAELDQLRGTLSAVSCPVGDVLPARCTTTVNGVAVQIDIVALDVADGTAGDVGAGYSVTVTLVDTATSS